MHSRDKSNISTQLQQKYRPDIDGLRAFAVLGVVLFHAFPTSIRGGFVGVDIFFVISGFLISIIIFNSLAEGFSFAEFYTRRIKRIFPALILILITIYSIGWYFLLSEEYKQLGKHIFAGSIFSSNILLWHEVGYFDNYAETKPLLHLWSLGIEEQFYLIYPVLLWITYRLRLNFLIVTIFITIISFCLNIRWNQIHPALTFYFPLTRFWELMIGSILAYLILNKRKFILQNLKNKNFSNLIIYNKKILSFNRKIWSNIISIIGLLLLIYSYFRIHKGLHYPGKWAIYPVLGTFLIILAGKEAWLNRKILSNKAVIYLGLISFPLYLWHWPILTFARISEGSTPLTVVRVSAILISILLSWITYEFIEKKIQRSKKNKILVAGCIGTLALIGFIGHLTFINNGFTSRNIVKKNLDESQDVYLESNPKTECEEIKFLNKELCEKFNAKESKKKILLWGDSSVKAWLPIFKDIAKKSNYSLISISHPSCPPLLNARKTTFLFPESKGYCSNGLMQSEVVKHISLTKPDLIIIIAGWNFYSPYTNREFITDLKQGEADKFTTLHTIKHQIPRTFGELSKIAKLVVFKSWPILPDPPNYRIKRIEFLQSAINNPYNDVYISTKNFSQDSSYTNEVFSKINSHNIIFYDPSSKICKGIRCDVTINSKNLYSDSYHITKQGSAEFRDDIEKILSM